MVETPLLLWTIMLSPIIGACVIAFFFLKKPAAAFATALASIVICLAASVLVFWATAQASHGHSSLHITYPWIQTTALSIPVGFLVDPMTAMMLLVVTFVGTCVFSYSGAYMHGDPGFSRYFASLCLFAFSMLGIVLAENFIQLFVFWELVAVSSYLLIGFWYEKPSAAQAARKAFIVNRVADFLMVIGIFSVWVISGQGPHDRTFSFVSLPDNIHWVLAHKPELTPHLSLAGLLVFCGVIGKSAQFPLYIWLPDAMEGPTPVSALIHAATMVAAGVYMMSRCFFLVESIPGALHIIAAFGCTTALLAASLALVQNDIKKILAYSTVSQLGFMVIALGLGSHSVAMYHLTTHAFFKALLFLGAGAMIHHLHTQDIWQMGGLLKKMPITAITFILGTAALCGVPPFAGFWSKDEILALAKHENILIYLSTSFAAFMTSFYMTRAIWVAVIGRDRAHAHGGHDKSHHDTHAHGSEAPWLMKWPLLSLAFLAVCAGFFGIGKFLAGEHSAHEVFHWDVAIISTLVSLAGIALSTMLYRNVGDIDPMKKILGPFYSVLENKYFLDDLFFAIAGFFQKYFAGALYWFDQKWIMQKMVDGSAKLVRSVSWIIRWLQNGRLQTYSAVCAFGVILLICLMMLKG